MASNSFLSGLAQALTTYGQIDLAKQSEESKASREDKRFEQQEASEERRHKETLALRASEQEANAQYRKDTLDVRAREAESDRIRALAAQAQAAAAAAGEWRLETFGEESGTPIPVLFNKTTGSLKLPGMEGGPTPGQPQVPAAPTIGSSPIVPGTSRPAAINAPAPSLKITDDAGQMRARQSGEARMAQIVEQLKQKPSPDVASKLNQEYQDLASKLK